jgi:hypothetical protein
MSNLMLYISKPNSTVWSDAKVMATRLNIPLSEYVSRVLREYQENCEKTPVSTRFE